MAGSPKPGTIAWHDLTVPYADPIRDFYEAVAGWRPEPVDMGGYSDSPLPTWTRASGRAATVGASWSMGPAGAAVGGWP